MKKIIISCLFLFMSFSLIFNGSLLKTNAVVHSGASEEQYIRDLYADRNTFIDRSFNPIAPLPPGYSINIEGSVDTSTLGEYVLDYVVFNISTSEITEFERTITVVERLIRLIPVVFVDDIVDLLDIYEPGDSDYELEVADDGGFDTSIPDTYEITYRIYLGTDSFTETVEVEVEFLAGETDIFIFVGDTIDLEALFTIPTGYTLEILDDDGFTTEFAGEYHVFFSVYNDVNDFLTDIIFTVHESPLIGNPVFYLGDVVDLLDVYTTLPGLTISVTSNGGFNPNVVGNYTVSFRVTQDTNALKFWNISKTLNVSLPALIGDKPEIKVGDVVNLLTIFNVGPEIILKVVDNGGFNTTTAGTYYVHYSLETNFKTYYVLKILTVTL